MRAQPRGQGMGCRFHLAEIQPAFRAARNRRADDRGAYPAELGRAGERAEPLRDHAAQLGGAEGGGFRAGPVADGGDAGGDGGLGQGETVRAESDDGEICGHGVGRPSQ